MHHVEPDAHVAVTDKEAALMVLGRADKVTHDVNVAGKSVFAAAAVAAPQATNGLVVLAPVHVAGPHAVTIVGNDTKPVAGLVLVYF